MKRIFGFLLALCLVPVLAGCGQKAETSAADTPTWQEQYDLGVRYLSEGNYQKAILAFTAAIEIDPKRADAYLGLADAYTAAGDIEQAQTILEAVLSEVDDPTVLEAKLQELSGNGENSTVSGEQYEFETEVLTNGSLNVDAQYLTVRVRDSRSAAVTISGISLKDSYPVNLSTSEESACEYMWQVDMYDHQNAYSVSTAWWAYGEPTEMALADMQHSVWVYDGDSWPLIGDAEMSYTSDSIIWSFTVPEEYPFDFADVERYEVSITSSPMEPPITRIYYVK